jgi:O-antigen/teichoic acid export membrane protein
MQLSTKIAYNTIIQIISKVIATALGLVAIAIITRYLGQKGFGEYTTIMTFLSFFGIIADLGLTLVTVQMISQPNTNQEKILGNLLGLRLVSAIIFLGLAPLVVLFFPYEPIIKIGIAITTLSFLFIALNQILVGLFQKNLRMDKVSIAEVLGRIILVIAVYLVIKNNWGLVGIMVATVLAGGINFLLHYIFSRQFVRIKLLFEKKVWKDIFSLSWPLALTIVFNLIYLKTDTLLLSLIKRPSEIGIIAEVGIYGAAYKVIDVLITFPFMFAGIILPILTARWAEKDFDSFKNILQKSFDLLVIIALPLTIGTQFVAKEVMLLVAGEEFAVSGPILQVLIFACLFIFLGNIFAHAIIAINKQRKIIGAYLFTAITAVIGYFIVIPRFSYFGAAWVTIYSEAFIALASVILIWKSTKFFPSLKIFVKSFFASIIMVASIYGAYFAGASNLFIVLLIAVITYFVFLFILRGLTKEDILVLFNKS